MILNKYPDWCYMNTSWLLSALWWASQLSNGKTFCTPNTTCVPWHFWANRTIKVSLHQPNSVSHVNMPELGHNQPNAISIDLLLAQFRHVYRESCMPRPHGLVSALPVTHSAGHYCKLYGMPNRTLLLIFWYQKMIFLYQKMCEYLTSENDFLISENQFLI